jgi:hypothetical protein
MQLAIVLLSVGSDGLSIIARSKSLTPSNSILKRAGSIQATQTIWRVLVQEWLQRELQEGGEGHWQRQRCDRNE